MEIYSKEEFIKDLEDYLETITVIKEDPKRMGEKIREQVVNWDWFAFIEFLKTGNY